jgi:hypothetical protein
MTQNRNGREATIKGQLSNYRVVQVSRTIKHGVIKHETILNIWANEFLNYVSAEKKIKGLKTETYKLNDGSTNEIKFVIMTNGDLNKQNGGF